MGRTWVVLLFWALVLAGGVSLCEAQVINGDFSNGINGWVTEGNVLVQNGAAVLGDNGDYSSLYQPIPLSRGPYTLEFDFRNELSGNVPVGTFLDTLFSSLLFFTNDLSQFDPKNPGNPGMGLFNLDFNGVFDNEGNGGPVTGTVSPSSKGPGWSHYSLSFQNIYRYAIPHFELFNLNGINSDSKVRLDNVQITSNSSVSVPTMTEWGEVLLILLLGLTVIRLFRIQKRA